MPGLFWTAVGQDIFCTKICGKIIESQFCLVILDDLVRDGVNIPNPNVYYEYGLMTSLGKHIIPLQKDGLKLAFNIQSYDTVKYTPRNIGTELDRAIKDAIKLSQTPDAPSLKPPVSERTLLRQFELAGFEPKDRHWFLDDVISDTCFRGFGNPDVSICAFVAKVDNADDARTFLEDTGVVILRTEKERQKREELLKTSEAQLAHIEQDPTTVQGLLVPTFQVTNRYEGPGRYAISRRKQELEKTVVQTRDELQRLEGIHIGLIIDPDVNRTALLKSATKLLAAHASFTLVSNTDDHLDFAGTSVSLNPVEV